ncbi:transposase [Apiospora marii]|uniref:Transposase n=1 Tax=Apiospora marii TaxID=335849 RepID=A0ABR1RK57_9PEZI
MTFAINFIDQQAINNGTKLGRGHAQLVQGMIESHRFNNKLSPQPLFPAPGRDGHISRGRIRRRGNDNERERALASTGWSKKTTRRVAEEWNADLRDFYSHTLSEFRSYHVVYIDESVVTSLWVFNEPGDLKA